MTETAGENRMKSAVYIARFTCAKKRILLRCNGLAGIRRCIIDVAVGKRLSSECCVVRPSSAFIHTNALSRDTGRPFPHATDKRHYSLNAAGSWIFMSGGSRTTVLRLLAADDPLRGRQSVRVHHACLREQCRVQEAACCSKVPAADTPAHRCGLRRNYAVRVTRYHPDLISPATAAQSANF